MAYAVQEQKLKCPSCGTARYRTSHFRLSDIPYLLVMQLPVRCSSCQERSHVGYRNARRIRKEERSRSFLVREASRSQAMELNDGVEARSGSTDRK
jgi:C4-type Zn-finger protein